MCFSRSFSLIASAVWLSLWLLHATAAAQTTAPESALVDDAAMADDPAKKKMLGLQIEAGASYERLNRRLPAWQTSYLLIIKQFAERKAVYTNLKRTRRFGIEDQELTFGAYHPLDSRTTLHVEAVVSPSHHILARWSTLVEVNRSLAKGSIGSIGWREVHFVSSRVAIFTPGFEQYIGHNLFSYKLFLAKPQNSSWLATHLIQATHLYGGSNLNVSVAIGHELETVGPKLLLQAKVIDLSFSGLQKISANWAVNYRVGWHKQGDFYTRGGLSFGMRRYF